MSRLVAYYEEEPVRTKGGVEVEQIPYVPNSPVLASDGDIRPNVVYVVVPSQVGKPLHVPFAAFDEWFLRDRYGEALRIVNTLGASSIECKTSRDSRRRSGVSAAVKGISAGLRRSRQQTNKATSVTINISSTTRHSVNGSLGKKLAGLGFELGVSGETSDAVSLHMVAKFPERSRWR